MAVNAGRCAACSRETWKFVQHSVTGQAVILWPRPWSRYPVFETANGDEAVGIGFCAMCPLEPPVVTANGSPLVLTSTVLRVESAHSRYAFYYTPEYGVFLRTWLRDEIELDKQRAGLIDETLAEWARDVAVDTLAAHPNGHHSAPEEKPAGGADEMNA